VTPKTDQQITQAFWDDGFEVKRRETFQGKRGFLAEHRDAFFSKPYSPGEPKVYKRAYYVEGDGYEMGYLMGIMAEDHVRRMTDDYVDKIIPEFFNPKLTKFSHNLLYQILLTIAKEWCEYVYGVHATDIPDPLKEEMLGVVDGCKAANPQTTVDYRGVLALNAGVDCVITAIYTGLGLYDRLDAVLPQVSGCLTAGTKVPLAGKLVKKFMPEITADMFRVPLACNALGAFGGAVNDGKVYFGRDFQFPMAGVFQDSSCFIVHRPTYTLEDGSEAIPTVSVSAPGFIGSATAMNLAGVAMGVDIVPSGNCDPERPGLNSLLMVRHATYCSRTAAEVVKAVVNAQRGASWIYPVADSSTPAAIAIEAGMTTDKYNYLEYPSDDYKDLLPPAVWPFAKWDKGVFAREAGWDYPLDYLEFNEKLFGRMGFPFDPAQFGPNGQLNPGPHEGPDLGYFFAPQRETWPDLMMVTNHYIVPEMRLCAMKEWTNIVAKSRMPDVLWRYDILNKLCQAAYGSINYAKAKGLIDFLRRGGDYDFYYAGNDIIEGSVSLCELTGKPDEEGKTGKRIESHFGYHDDLWVKLHLDWYV
jgi:hypothetical protein